MRTRDLSCLLSLALILSGCATVGGMSENLASIPPGKGVALFSTGAAKTKLSFSTRLALIQGSSRKQYSQVNINLDYPAASDFSGEHGHVRNLVLPAGEYYLMPVAVNPFSEITKGSVYRFQVAEGRTTYLGNFFLANDVISWSDQMAQRDSDLFRRKNPAFAATKIEPQKVELAGDLADFQ